MKFISGSPSRDSYAIALGNFDGLHHGHKAVIETTMLKAQHLECKSAVVTFSPHPRRIFSKNDFKEILSLDKKIKMIKNLYIDEVFVIDFSPQLIHQSPDEFIRNLLSVLDIKSITTGYNFRFGNNRQGDIMTLDRLGHRHSFAFNAINQVFVDDIAVSSSALRSLIAMGCLELFYKLTGYRYHIECNIVQSNKPDNIIAILASASGRHVSLYEVSDTDLIMPPDGFYFCEGDKNEVLLVLISKMQLYTIDFYGKLMKPRVKFNFIKLMLQYSQSMKTEHLKHAVEESCRTINFILEVKK